MVMMAFMMPLLVGFSSPSSHLILHVAQPGVLDVNDQNSALGDKLRVVRILCQMNLSIERLLLRVLVAYVNETLERDGEAARMQILAQLVRSNEMGEIVDQHGNFIHLAKVFEFGRLPLRAHDDNFVCLVVGEVHQGQMWFAVFALCRKMCKTGSIEQRDHGRWEGRCYVPLETTVVVVLVLGD